MSPALWCMPPQNPRDRSEGLGSVPCFIFFTEDSSFLSFHIVFSSDCKKVNKLKIQIKLFAFHILKILSLLWHFDTDHHYFGCHWPAGEVLRWSSDGTPCAPALFPCPDGTHGTVQVSCYEYSPVWRSAGAITWIHPVNKYLLRSYWNNFQK